MTTPISSGPALTMNDTQPIKRNKKSLTVVVTVVLLLLLGNVVFVLYMFSRTSSDPVKSKFQTCALSPNSQGCNECTNKGEKSAVCNKCEDINLLRLQETRLSDTDLDYYNEYCSDSSSQLSQTCAWYPNSEGCQSCKNEGLSSELCLYCEGEEQLTYSLEFQRKCVYPVQEFLKTTSQSVYISGEYYETKPFELFLEDPFQTQYTFEGFYPNDIATITESADNVGFIVKYDFEDLTMNIFVENELRSSLKDQVIYSSYDTEIIDTVETKYLGNIYKVVYSDTHLFTNSYLSEECQSIPDSKTPNAFLKSPCGNGLLKSKELKDSTDWAISGLSISCVTEREGIAKEHTSQSSGLCYDFVNNLLVKKISY